MVLLNECENLQLYFCVAGNTVVVVPGMPTAPPSLLLAQLFGEAGLPVGVLNVITGSDVSLGAKVAQNPNMAYMTFTGNKQVCI